MACATSTRFSNLGFAPLETPLLTGQVDDNISAADIKKIAENRKEFLGLFGVDLNDLVCLKQVHSDKVYKATGKDRGKGAREPQSRIYGFDALVTDEPGVAIAIFTADCIPVFLYDKKKNVIGIVHAGWRGTKEEISKKTISELKNSFGTDPKDLIAAIGPGIRKCCYKVKENVATAFGDSARKIGAEYYLDLAKENIKQLLDSGINNDNIYDSKICTACQNDLLFSYRKEADKAGRMMNFIYLK